jgi:diguanylate cyclase (GGDEF)-like protein
MDAIGHHVSLKTGSNIKKLIPLEDGADRDGFSMDRLPPELRSARRNFYVSLAGHALEPFRGKLVGYAIVLTDITRLKLRAEIDPLTQIYNREGLNNAFSDLLRNAQANPSLSAMVIDLDNFKSINDAYGHLGGDTALNDFVETAQSLLSDDSFMGRIGGDEFVLVLPVDLETAIVFAKRLQRLVSERVVPYLKRQIQYTISIGVAACPSAGCTLAALIHQADMSLYRAKEQGKNTISM